MVRKSGGSSATIITKSFRSRHAFAIRRDEYSPLAYSLSEEEITALAHYLAHL
jgi:hypothetical protein